MPTAYPAHANDNNFVAEEDLLLEHAEWVEREYPEVREQILERFKKSMWESYGIVWRE